jgi:hypothetical protein
MPRELALSDQIVELSRTGKIPTPFTVADIRKHASEFSERHIKTVLSNYEKDGDMVKRGQRARFVRVTEGKYKPL